MSQIEVNVGRNEEATAQHRPHGVPFSGHPYDDRWNSVARRLQPCREWTVWFVIWIAGIFVSYPLPSAAASTAVPHCRFDDELAPAVRTALRWGLDDLRKAGLALPFDDIVINSRTPVSARTLHIQIVKEATTRTVDPQGCIRQILVNAAGIPTRTDGPCLATRLEACNDEDVVYMSRRFREIHGGFSDAQTGYEMAGACYMTNLQACLHQHRLALLKELGPRDAISVKGTCVASARNTVGIQCSAGALKMLVSHEAIAAKAPTLGILLILSHELGHLATGQTSTYDGSDGKIDLSWSVQDKIARIQTQCRAGESLRKRESDADEIALRIARGRLPEIAKSWPKQGTTAWLVTQLIHQSTNLTRWNNDWHDRTAAEMPAVFRQKSEGGVITFDEDDINNIMAGVNVSGQTRQQVERAARGFLCEMASTRSGRWDVLMQSGSTHGTMMERLGELAATLRPIKGDPSSRLEGLEVMLGGMGDLGLKRHRAYLRELEGAICTLVEQPLDCSATTLGAQSAPARTKSAAASRAAAESTRLPLTLNMGGPYREVAGEPAALTLAIKSVEFRPDREAAITTGKEIAASYSALLGQIDRRLRDHGGYWVNVVHSPVDVSYNRFTGQYSASIELRAVVRAPRSFVFGTLEALTAIRKWGRVDDVYLRPWNDARHEVVIHFFRSDTPGASKDSQRVITNALRFDQIFDLAAARAGHPNQAAGFFRDLLPFLHARLKSAFGGAYTLTNDSPPSPFYITSGGLGENFYLPADWQPLIESAHARAVSDADLGAAVNRVYIDNAREQNVAAIFRDVKP